jgi:hypothetical protein
MPECYIFAADVYCEDCTRNHLMEQDEVMIAFPDLMGGGAHLIRTEDMLAELVRANGCDPENPATWDSGDYPKGPEADGGGEADSPQNCCVCGAFLENPLTSDGYEYVLEQVRMSDVSVEVLLADVTRSKAGLKLPDDSIAAMVEWLAFYGDDDMNREPRLTLNQVIALEPIMKRWDALRDVPTIEAASGASVIDIDFEDFPKGTDIEDIWHAFEADCPEFSAGEAMQGRYAGVLADSDPYQVALDGRNRGRRGNRRRPGRMVDGGRLVSRPRQS